MRRTVRYHRKGGQPRYGTLSADGKIIHELTGGLHGSHRAGDVPVEVERTRVIAPVQPSKVVCVGLNHSSTRDALEMTPSRDPLIFLKAPNSVIGPMASIVCPAGIEAVDVAAELAVVIGRRARHLTESEAMDHVFGFTCANDVGIREWLGSDNQWFRAKSADTFCPIGPWISDLSDPDAVQLTLSVNGEVRQSGSTADLIWNIPQIIAYTTAYATLEPGDIILMGSPDGLVTAFPGDTVEVAIEGIGSLVNVVAAPFLEGRTA